MTYKTWTPDSEPPMVLEEPPPTLYEWCLVTVLSVTFFVLMSYISLKQIGLIR